MRTAPDSGADYLFVYGVLRRSNGKKINCILTQSGIFLGDGAFRGKLYKVGYYPGAVRSDCESDIVVGDVYLLQDPEKVLEVMDEFEGCRSTKFSKGEFYRDKVAVCLESGEEINAWAYIYNRPTEGLKVIPSGDYWKR
jgi:gamma-glutamylcyclotransferase (GGCT)/AIG2-like uncharacterized protein YtfP